MFDGVNALFNPTSLVHKWVVLLLEMPPGLHHGELISDSPSQGRAEEPKDALHLSLPGQPHSRGRIRRRQDHERVDQVRRGGLGVVCSLAEGGPILSLQVRVRQFGGAVLGGSLSRPGDEGAHQDGGVVEAQTGGHEAGDQTGHAFRAAETGR